VIEPPVDGPPEEEPDGSGEPDEHEPPEELSPEAQAERARRAERSSRGVLAAILGLEAVVVLLIPRTIAFTTGLGPVRTGICIGLAVVLVLGAGLVRRPWGIGLGSVLQVAFFATGILIATMFLIGAIFIAIWLRVLMFRHDAAGRPGGARMLLG
jgi:hypothetical protein